MKTKNRITIVIPLDPKKDSEDVEKQFKDTGARVIIKKGYNPSENRNLGAKEAKTPLIAFINAHTTLSNNWLGEVYKFFKENPEIDIVGGPQLTPESSSYFEKVSGYALSSKFGASEVSARYKKMLLNLNADETMLTSANLICKKKVFEKITFDEKLYPGEDPKFIFDAKKEGFKVAYCPNIIVYNERRKNIKSFVKQIFRYGYTRPEKESILETIRKPFFLVPSMFIIYLIFIPILLLISKFFVIPLIIYILLNFMFSVVEGMKNKDPLSIIYLFIIFPAVHISYGLGFLMSSLNKSLKGK